MYSDILRMESKRAIVIVPDISFKITVNGASARALPVLPIWLTDWVKGRKEMLNAEQNFAFQ